MRPACKLAFLILNICSAALNHARGQGKFEQLSDSISLRSHVVVYGDSVSISYDSAYILNKKTYKVFNDTYNRVRNGNSSSRELIHQYDKLINLQDSLIKSKEEYYQKLRVNFDSLSANSLTVAQRTEDNVGAINASLADATTQLNSIQLLLKDAMDKTKSIQKQKIKLAVGGFTVGVGLAALIFLIAK